MLILSRKLNEAIQIGDKIKITVVEIRGNKIRLGIEAPGDVEVYRQEIWTTIQQERAKQAESAN